MSFFANNFKHAVIFPASLILFFFQVISCFSPASQNKYCNTFLMFQQALSNFKSIHTQTSQICSPWMNLVDVNIFFLPISTKIQTELCVKQSSQFVSRPLNWSQHLNSPGCFADLAVDIVTSFLLIFLPAGIGYQTLIL